MTDQKGGILLEGVVALLLLCMLIVSVMTMSSIIIRGEAVSKLGYEEAFALNSIRDQAVAQVHENGAFSPAEVVSAVGNIIAAHPGWRFSLNTSQPPLYDILLIHDTPSGEHTYVIRIFTEQE